LRQFCYPYQNCKLMKIPSWPAWFPHPISCLKGFVLSYAFTSAVKSEFPLQPGESIVPILIAGWIWVALLFIFFNWASGFATKLIMTHLPQNPSLAKFHQHLTTWSSTKQPPWKEGLNACIISFVTSIPVSFIVFLIIPAPSRFDAYRYNAYALRQAMIQVRFTLIPIGMTVISAYLYQYDIWARQRGAAKQERRSQDSTPEIPTPPVPTTTFNQSTPEVAEWYVFRSGPKGPYTKLQLWEIQKITARTKVRRGETDWQRAGEVPELAKYLTEK
jgi:hypothetical protein